VLRARLSKVHLRVDHAGHERQAPPVDHLADGCVDDADLRDDAVFDPQVAHGKTRVVTQPRQGELDLSERDVASHEH